VQLSNATLTTAGPNAAATVSTRQAPPPGNQPTQIAVTLNDRLFTFKASAVTLIQAQLGLGADNITLDESSLPVTPPSIFDGGGGSDVVVVTGTAGADAFTVTGTSVSLTGAGPLHHGHSQGRPATPKGGTATRAV